MDLTTATVGNDTTLADRADIIGQAKMIGFYSTILRAGSSHVYARILFTQYSLLLLRYLLFV